MEIEQVGRRSCRCLWRSTLIISAPDSMARLLDEWVTGIGLRSKDYGTHSLRRTKASIIYKQTGGNLRALQILLGHTKIAPMTVDQPTRQGLQSGHAGKKGPWRRRVESGHSGRN
jgi:integrase